MSKIFFWLKSNFGFSRKESRGFILVLPILLIVYWLPGLMNSSKHPDNTEIVQAEIDSLLSAGWKPVKSDLNFNPQDTSKVNKTAKSSAFKAIPISEADSIVLQIVPGIGPKLAGRIIRYRENLGGFHSENQLAEVYGLSPEVSETAWDYFFLAEPKLKKIPINLVEREELAAHPYISYGAAKVIIAYREQHGFYQSSSDLSKIKIFEESWIDQIEPYLDFQQ